MSNDKSLTCIFLTLNKVPEGWARYHKSVLLEAVGDTPIITISKKPLDWGLNLIQEGEPSVNNIYKQLLRGCKLATTPYIAVIEDDTLYHKSHFTYRPPMDTYAYNMHRWGIFTWGTPTYYYKRRISNAAMIAPRELVIKSLEDRFEKYPDSDRISELGNERGVRLEKYEIVNFYSDVSMVYFCHVNGLDPTERHESKKMSPIQAYDIKFWGKAQELVSHWYE